MSSNDAPSQRVVIATTQDRDLVAQHEVLDLLGSVSKRQQHKQLDDAPQRQVGKGPEHDRRSFPAGRPARLRATFHRIGGVRQIFAAVDLASGHLNTVHKRVRPAPKGVAPRAVPSQLEHLILRQWVVVGLGRLDGGRVAVTVASCTCWVAASGGPVSHSGSGLGQWAEPA